MRISYDEEEDAMYIAQVEGDHECRTVRLTDEVAQDFGPAEQLVGIEILDTRRVLGKGKLPRLVVDRLPLPTTAPNSRCRTLQTVKAERRGAGRHRKPG
jgi:uncharacterized protein YuzE